MHQYMQKTKTTKIRGLAIVAFASLLGASVAHGQSFSDDFNRPDTSFSSDGSQIGPNWVVGVGEWRILNNQLQNSNQNMTIYNTTVGMADAAGEFTTLSGTVQTGDDTGNWSGMLFHFQESGGNSGEYYALRIKPDADSYQPPSRSRPGKDRG